MKKKAEKDEIIDEIKSEIDLIEKKIQAKKKAQIGENKAQIKKLLEIEIASRYYLQEGKIQNRLSGDADIDEAIKILNDKARYKSILTGQPVK